MDEDLIEIPDEHLIALGKLVTNYARLEQQLNMLIGKIAGFDNLSDPIYFIMINHVSISQKIDILSAICEERLQDYPHLEGYKNVMTETRNVTTLRNKYVHNSMLFDPKKNCCLLGNASARGKLKVKMEYVELKDLDNVELNIRRVMMMLHNLILNVNFPLPTE